MNTCDLKTREYFSQFLLVRRYSGGTWNYSRKLQGSHSSPINFEKGPLLEEGKRVYRRV
jgi:hypothetical protein